MNPVSPQVRDWLARLVAIDSTTRVSNRPVVDLIAGAARDVGIEPRIFPREDGKQANCLVSIPAADGSIDRGVLLSGHTDCVPVDGQDWTSDPFELTERAGRVYGRGTADMKGFVAVCLAALPSMVAEPLAEPLHLAFTYDEEIGCAGAPALVASLAGAGIAPRVGFVGEPTSMRMIRGHKSINVVEVAVTGVSAHSSLTADGVNAIEYAAQVVRRIRDRAERWRAEGPFDPAYPVAYTTASVNQIEGGTAQNIVPRRCVVTLEFRAIAATDDEAEIAALRRFCAEVEERMRAEGAGAGASVSMTVLSSAVGLDTPPGASVVRLGADLGLARSDDKVTYATEAGIFAAAGIETVVCGPGDIAQAHKADEYVELDQLAQCEAFVGRLVARLRRPAV